MCNEFLCIVGLATFIFYGFKIGWAIFVRHFAPPKIGQYLHQDSWAVITGGSDGIGLGLAKKFLKEGFHVVLVGRNKQKLQEAVAVVQKCNVKRKVEIRISEASDISDKNINGLVESLCDRNVSVLVNNVGVANEKGAFYESVTSKSVEEMCGINCTYPAKLTRAFLPLLKESKKALILNISSVLGVTEIPLMSVYPATKAFNRYFSLSLAREAFRDGIFVQTIEPGNVRTNLNQTPEKWDCCNPDVFAEATFKVIGWEKESVPFWPHLLQVKTMLPLQSIVPDKIALKMMVARMKK